MNVVADVLSRKTRHTATLIIKQTHICTDLERAGIAVLVSKVIVHLAQLSVQPTLRQRIIESHREDPNFISVFHHVKSGQTEEFTVTTDQGLL